MEKANGSKKTWSQGISFSPDILSAHLFYALVCSRDGETTLTAATPPPSETKRKSGSERKINNTSSYCCGSSVEELVNFLTSRIHQLEEWNNKVKQSSFVSKEQCGDSCADDVTHLSAFLPLNLFQLGSSLVHFALRHSFLWRAAPPAASSGSGDAATQSTANASEALVSDTATLVAIRTVAATVLSQIVESTCTTLFAGVLTALLSRCFIHSTPPSPLEKMSPDVIRDDLCSLQPAECLWKETARLVKLSKKAVGQLTGKLPERHLDPERGRTRSEHSGTVANDQDATLTSSQENHSSGASSGRRGSGATRIMKSSPYLPSSGSTTSSVRSAKTAVAGEKKIKTDSSKVQKSTTTTKTTTTAPNTTKGKKRQVNASRRPSHSSCSSVSENETHELPPPSSPPSRDDDGAGSYSLHEIREEEYGALLRQLNNVRLMVELLSFFNGGPINERHQGHHVPLEGKDSAVHTTSQVVEEAVLRATLRGVGEDLLQWGNQIFATAKKNTQGTKKEMKEEWSVNFTLLQFIAIYLVVQGPHVGDGRRTVGSTSSAIVDRSMLIAKSPILSSLSPHAWRCLDAIPLAVLSADVFMITKQVLAPAGQVSLTSEKTERERRWDRSLRSRIQGYTTRGWFSKPISSSGIMPSIEKDGGLHGPLEGYVQESIPHCSTLAFCSTKSTPQCSFGSNSVGLRNPGNYCFMNAVFQLLFQASVFRQALIESLNLTNLGVEGSIQDIHRSTPPPAPENRSLPALCALGLGKLLRDMDISKQVGGETAVPHPSIFPNTAAPKRDELDQDTSKFPHQSCEAVVWHRHPQLTDTMVMGASGPMGCSPSSKPPFLYSGGGGVARVTHNTTGNFTLSTNSAQSSFSESAAHSSQVPSPQPFSGPWTGTPPVPAPMVGGPCGFSPVSCSAMPFGTLQPFSENDHHTDAPAPEPIHALDYFLVLPAPFDNGEQHDASEFAKVLLAQLDEWCSTDLAFFSLSPFSSSPSPSPSPPATSSFATSAAGSSYPPSLVAKYFGGCMVTIVECLGCYDTRTSLEWVWDWDTPLYEPFPMPSYQSGSKKLLSLDSPPLVGHTASNSLTTPLLKKGFLSAMDGRHYGNDTHTFEEMTMTQEEYQHALAGSGAGGGHSKGPTVGEESFRERHPYYSSGGSVNTSVVVVGGASGSGEGNTMDGALGKAEDQKAEVMVVGESVDAVKSWAIAVSPLTARMSDIRQVSQEEGAGCVLQKMEEMQNVAEKFSACCTSYYHHPLHASSRRSRPGHQMSRNANLTPATRSTRPPGFTGIPAPPPPPPPAPTHPPPTNPAPHHFFTRASPSLSSSSSAAAALSAVLAAAASTSYPSVRRGNPQQEYFQTFEEVSVPVGTTSPPHSRESSEGHVIRSNSRIPGRLALTSNGSSPPPQPVVPTRARVTARTLETGGPSVQLLSRPVRTSTVTISDHELSTTASSQLLTQPMCPSTSRPEERILVRPSSHVADRLRELRERRMSRTGLPPRQGSSSSSTSLLFPASSTTTTTAAFSPPPPASAPASAPEPASSPASIALAESVPPSPPTSMTMHRVSPPMILVEEMEGPVERSSRTGPHSSSSTHRGKHPIVVVGGHERLSDSYGGSLSPFPPHSAAGSGHEEPRANIPAAVDGTDGLSRYSGGGGGPDPDGNVSPSNVSMMGAADIRGSRQWLGPGVDDQLSLSSDPESVSGAEEEFEEEEQAKDTERGRMRMVDEEEERNSLPPPVGGDEVYPPVSTESQGTVSVLREEQKNEKERRIRISSGNGNHCPPLPHTDDGPQHRGDSLSTETEESPSLVSHIVSEDRFRARGGNHGLAATSWSNASGSTSLARHPLPPLPLPPLTYSGGSAVRQTPPPSGAEGQQKTQGQSSFAARRELHTLLPPTSTGSMTARISFANALLVPSSGGKGATISVQYLLYRLLHPLNPGDELHDENAVFCSACGLRTATRVRAMLADKEAASVVQLAQDGDRASQQAMLALLSQLEEVDAPSEESEDKSSSSSSGGGGSSRSSGSADGVHENTLPSGNASKTATKSSTTVKYTPQQENEYPLSTPATAERMDDNVLENGVVGTTPSVKPPTDLKHPSRYCLKNKELKDDGLPLYFHIQLHRFCYDAVQDRVEKLLHRVGINEVILVPYLSTTKANGGNTSHSGAEATSTTRVKHAERRTRFRITYAAYRLSAIVMHAGDQHSSGHYYTLIKRRVPTPPFSNCGENGHGDTEAALAAQLQFASQAISKSHVSRESLSRNPVFHHPLSDMVSPGGNVSKCSFFPVQITPSAIEGWNCYNDDVVNTVEPALMRQILHGEEGCWLAHLAPPSSSAGASSFSCPTMGKLHHTSSTMMMPAENCSTVTREHGGKHKFALDSDTSATEGRRRPASPSSTSAPLPPNDVPYLLLYERIL